MSGGEPCCLIRSPAGRVLCAVTGLAITNDRAATMGTLAVSFRINQSPDQPVPGHPPEGTRLPGPTRKDEVQLRADVAGIAAHDRVDADAFVKRACRQPVDAGQVEQFDRLTLRRRELAPAALDGYAGIVGRLRAPAGQAV